MLIKQLQGYNLILASGSPRRKQLLEEMGLTFQVRPTDADEHYPQSLEGAAIAEYLAELKSEAYPDTLSAQDLLLTSDTIVWHQGKSLAKPADAEEAREMISALSGSWHEVITGVCLRGQEKRLTRHRSTQVKFRELTPGEVQYYIETYKPFDKAGGYGIQEWIGLVGISEIKGSYSNVVGLPTALVYELLFTITR